MKWWKKSKKKNDLKPFLVLPLEIYDFTILNKKKNAMVRKKPNLKLFVTSNKENSLQNQDQDQGRPLTATLEKPQILNIQFLGKIDMSLMRKEFLTISNLCLLPLTKVNNSVNTDGYNKSKSAFKTYRKRAFKKVVETEDEVSSSDRKKLSNRHRQYVKLSDINSDKGGVQGQIKQINSPFIGRQRPTLGAHNTNDVRIKNNSIITRTDAPVNKTSAAIFKSTKHDQFSCSSCGRSDKPERFHTHFSNKKVSLPKRNPSPTKLGGGTIVSPIKKIPKSEEIKTGKTKENLAKMNSKLKQEGNGNSDVKMKGPRTLICYLCGRQYGTASLKLHEPKCIEKWHRENSKLPRHLRRALPQKPDHAQTPDEWNNNAWKTMQDSLVPCINCNRTFLPDRLEVHQRSCKPPLNALDKSSSRETIKRTSVRKSNSPPRWVQCSICGKNFGTHSLKIHEESCAKKAELQNNNYLSNDISTKQEVVTNVNSESCEEKTNSGRRPRILPCYICGRPFSISSINIHEPQCLKKWKIQNDKLPKDKRRPEPKKPDFVFTPIGDLNYEATFDRIWDNHLSELIPCNRCGRTFFPDRIEKHERACAGNGIKSKTVK